MKDPNPMARIAASLGPSRWHPFKRRSWARLMANTDGAHWSHHAEAERTYLVGTVYPLATEMAEQLSDDLPDGYSLVWDPQPLTVIPSSGIPVQGTVES